MKGEGLKPLLRKSHLHRSNHFGDLNASLIHTRESLALNYRITPNSISISHVVRLIGSLDSPKYKPDLGFQDLSKRLRFLILGSLHDFSLADQEV